MLFPVLNATIKINAFSCLLMHTNCRACGYNSNDIGSELAGTLSFWLNKQRRKIMEKR